MDKRFRNLGVILIVVIVIVAAYYIYTFQKPPVDQVSKQDLLIQNDIKTIENVFSASKISFSKFNDNEMVYLARDLSVVKDTDFDSLQGLKNSLKLASIKSSEGIELKQSYVDLIELQNEKKEIFDSINSILGKFDANDDYYPQVCNDLPLLLTKIGEYNSNVLKMSSVSLNQSKALQNSGLAYEFFSSNFSDDSEMISYLNTRYDLLSGFCLLGE